MKHIKSWNTSTGTLRTSPHFPENRIIFWIGHILKMYFWVHNSTQPFRSRKILLGMTSNRKSKSRFMLRIIACSSFTIRRLSLEPAESTDLSPRSYTEPRHPRARLWVLEEAEANFPWRRIILNWDPQEFHRSESNSDFQSKI